MPVTSLQVGIGGVSTQESDKTALSRISTLAVALLIMNLENCGLWQTITLDVFWVVFFFLLEYWHQ